MLMSELQRLRRNLGIAYFILLIVANLAFTQIGLKLYSPFDDASKIENITLLILYLLIQSIGFVLANAFGYGIPGLLAMSSGPILLSKVDVESYVKFTVIVSTFLASWFSFYDGLWVWCGRYPLKKGDLPLARTLKTFLTGGSNKVLGSALFSSLIVPIPVAFHYVFFSMAKVNLNPEWIALSKSSIPGFVVALLPLLGIRELTYLSINRLDYKSKLYILVAIAYLIPALALASLGFELVGVSVGFVSSVLATKKAYPKFRQTLRETVEPSEESIEESIEFLSLIHI